MGKYKIYIFTWFCYLIIILFLKEIRYIFSEVFMYFIVIGIAEYIIFFNSDLEKRKKK